MPRTSRDRATSRQHGANRRAKAKLRLVKPDDLAEMRRRREQAHERGSAA